MIEIKKKTEVKASNIRIDLNKKLVDVVEENKKGKDKSKFKPTVPNAGSNLYPDPKAEDKKKLEKIKKNLDKQNDAENMRIAGLQDTKDRLKDRNEQIRKAAEEQKKK